MAVKTRSELEDAADEIRDETGEGANTATRVGGFLRDAIDSMPLASEVTTPPPADAEYIVSTASGGLSAERVLTDTTTIVWDVATASVVRANVPDGSLARVKLADGIACSVIGRVSNSLGQVQDIQAGANDRVLARSSDVVGFVQITRGMVQAGEIISTHIEADAVGNSALRNSGACSVIGRSANSSGDPADISAATNDRLFCRVSDTLQFSQLTAGMVPNDLVTNAMLRDSGACSVIGRSALSSGDPADISASVNDTVLTRAGNVLAFTAVSTAMIALDAI